MVSRMNNNIGWICPVCGRVNAPWITKCPCSPKEQNNNKPEQKQIPCYTCLNYPASPIKEPCKKCPKHESDENGTWDGYENWYKKVWKNYGNND